MSKRISNKSKKARKGTRYARSEVRLGWRKRTLAAMAAGVTTS